MRAATNLHFVVLDQSYKTTTASKTPKRHWNTVDLKSEGTNSSKHDDDNRDDSTDAGSIILSSLLSSLNMSNVNKDKFEFKVKIFKSFMCMEKMNTSEGADGVCSCLKTTKFSASIQYPATYDSCCISFVGNLLEKDCMQFDFLTIMERCIETVIEFGQCLSFAISINRPHFNLVLIALFSNKILFSFYY
ncbi:uncharacterized protein LOC142338492 [Convolutriloba macropyga]|uniref:uncharacterized protein LOC142338492 n=1 Tax=Convolutriloba macropyga TaxID=536237 RepID=UPI003F522CC1